MVTNGVFEVNDTKKNPKTEENVPPVIRMVEDIVGCKWSLTILEQVRQGINRPGIIERSIEGLTTKVMNERLSKLVRYRILERVAYPEVPPRVEYNLTGFGQKFIVLLDSIETLQHDLSRTTH